MDRDRRGFLTRALRGGTALLILPAGAALAGCVSGSGTLAADTTAAAPGNGLRFTSNVAGQHTHDLTLATRDLAAPPAAGLTGPTTVTLGHYHLVELTEDELARIQAGQTVMRATSIAYGHLHTFKLSLDDAEPPGTAPTSSDAASAG